MTVYVRPLQELIPPELLKVLGEEKVLRAVVESIAEGARDKWIQLAGESFHRTRRDYVNGIQPVRMRARMAVVSLVGNWPNKLENGMDPYDQRTTLLGPRVPVVPPGERGKHVIWEKRGEGASARKVAKGYYRHIPFRHLAPTSQSALGTQMGRALEKHVAPEMAQKLGKMVYALAKELQPYATIYEGYPGAAPAFARGGYFGEDYPEEAGLTGAGRAKRLQFPVEEFGTVAHMHAKYYGGMVRNEKTYERATQSQYFTFRTISTRGPAWKHPGLPGKKLGEQVSQYVAKIADESFSAFAKGSKG